MRGTSSSATVSWVAGLCLAWCLAFVGCGETSSTAPQSVNQTEEQKAQQAAADKATADAHKAEQKKK